jgi:hypothetical protein
MQRFLIVFIFFLAVGCHKVAYDPVFNENIIEIYVQRMAPTEELIVMGYHDEPDYVDAEFLVLEPEKYAGRKFKLRLAPESCDSFFSNQQFWIRVPENVTLGKNRERKNKDGGITVYGDTLGNWDFTTLLIKK